MRSLSSKAQSLDDPEMILNGGKPSQLYYSTNDATHADNSTKSVWAERCPDDIVAF